MFVSGERNMTGRARQLITPVLLCLKNGSSLLWSAIRATPERDAEGWADVFADA